MSKSIIEGTRHHSTPFALRSADCHHGEERQHSLHRKNFYSIYLTEIQFAVNLMRSHLLIAEIEDSDFEKRRRISFSTDSCAAGVSAPDVSAEMTLLRYVGLASGRAYSDGDFCGKIPGAVSLRLCARSRATKAHFTRPSFYKQP
jgi:hypothetical protein